MHVKREVGSVTPSPGLSSRAGRRGEEGSVGWKGGNLLTAEKGNSAQRREAHVGPQEEGQSPDSSSGAGSKTHRLGSSQRFPLFAHPCLPDSVLDSELR